MLTEPLYYLSIGATFVVAWLMGRYTERWTRGGK